jgi:hypothetical protein
MFVPYLACFILSWGALSTYHKWLNPIFKKPKTDCFWFNWLAHGMGIGLACLPLLTYIPLINILCRVTVLGITIMLWSELNDNAVWEEVGRGVLIICTLPLL